MSPFFYLFLAVLVGAAGINRSIGFWGYFALSLLLTPIGGLVILWLTRDRHAHPSQEH